MDFLAGPRSSSCLTVDAVAVNIESSSPVNEISNLQVFEKVIAGDIILFLKPCKQKHGRTLL